jgi:hypothetical protein
VDPTKFGILVRVVIGAKGEPGEDSFDVMVCTPKWISDQFREPYKDHIFGRHYLIVASWSFAELRGIISELVEGIGGDDWQDFASRLDRYMHWEFGAP